MAVAKNFAFHGVWGVTPYEFASCQSTTIWHLLLAAIFRLVGPSESAPLVLATLFACLSIWPSYGFLKSFGQGQVDIFSVLVAFILFTPLPTLVLSGMEHTLHALFDLSQGESKRKVERRAHSTLPSKMTHA